MRSLASKLTLSIGILTIVFSTFLFYQTYTLTNRKAGEIVEQQAAMALKFELATRQYVAQHIRPLMYDLLGEDEFIPEAMSTSFVARSIFEEVRNEFPQYIIKFSSDNPRNPANQAGPEELNVIDYFNRNPEVKRWSGRIKIGGRLYFSKFSARRMKESCLRCHGDPKDAPLSMIERYGDKAGFHRPLGEVIGLDTVAIPVSEISEALFSESVHTFLLSGLGIILFFLIGTMIFQFFVTKPLSSITNHMSDASSHTDYKHIEKIQVTSKDEIGDLASSFNVLLLKLQEFYGTLEKKVKERTTDLSKANEELHSEIETRKQTEKSLEFAQFAIDHFSDSTFFMRKDASLIFANKSACRSLEYTYEELMEKTVPNWDPNYSKDKWQRYWTAVKKRKALLFESIHQTKNGSIFPVEVSTNYIEFDGVEYTCAIARDISERKKAEIEKRHLENQLQRALKMEAIGTLAGGVAHDLNNILSGIVSYPELILLEMPKDHKYRRPIEIIQKSGTKAAEIVQDLLTLARRGASQATPLNFNRIIKDYLDSPELVKMLIEHSNCAIQTNLDEHLLNINGSEVHLSKVIMNLAINALEAMPKGGELTISTENCYIDRLTKEYDEIQEGNYVLIKISDTGIGISEGDKEKIFEPFYTKKVMGRSGTGLGMTVVWGAVKDHDGFIDIQTEIGSGTTFKLYFPASSKLICEPQSDFNIEPSKGSGEHILVVDDVLEQRQIATAILEQLNYTVISVDSGEAAIEYLADHSVDLVVLDMIMEPGIDGLETYKQIARRHPGQKAIVVSGFSESGRVKAVQRLGAGEYVRKPYTINKIGLAIKSALNRE
jgi:two-component system, cell cycle sensor histidine kinase and response regulator CckA